jgi:hypothetical protein
MHPQGSKIRAEHLQRRACVYVRQSTVFQVTHHRESTERQYNLGGFKFEVQRDWLIG